jgi:hypothetical protein
LAAFLVSFSAFFGSRFCFACAWTLPEKGAAEGCAEKTEDADADEDEDEKEDEDEDADEVAVADNDEDPEAKAELAEGASAAGGRSS